MQLRSKITLLLASVLTVSVVANYTIQRVAVAPSFRALERDDAMKDWERCRAAIMREQEALSMACFDWSSWDHAYEFVKDANPKFVEENLENLDWYTDQHIDALYFCRPDGTVYWSHLTPMETGETPVLASLPRDRLPHGQPLMAVTDDKESRVLGLVRTEVGLMILASRPILKSNNEGPMAGVLIFGRLVTPAIVEALRAQTGVQFDILDARSESLSGADRAGLAAAIEAGAPVEALVDSARLTVRGVIDGLDGTPVMMIQTSGERRISQQGDGALNVATVSLLAAGLLTLAVLLWAMRWLVLGPLASLTGHATHVGKSGRLDGTVDLKRDDELGTLARAFDEMLKQLEEFRTNSVALSRQAGMAEVAAGVLHNVGNAMTNVNVLADTLTGKLAKSASPRLSKVSALLAEHQHDLPGFFGSGHPGQQLPGYIAQLSNHLNSEMADYQRDLTELREGLQHVKEIVASHQGLASTSNFVEQVDVGEMIAKSLLIVAASLEKHGIGVGVDVPAKMFVVCDRSKMSQVLVNIVTNAKEAMVAAKTPCPRLEIRAGGGEKGAAFIEIGNNGPGIGPEHKAKLFSKGFTTKAEGHGIGLHYCWLAMREMNGTLGLVESSAGRGTTFRIELPASVVKERLAA